MCRQGLVGQIIINVNSGSYEEVGVSMKVLVNIASGGVEGVTPLRIFLPFLTSLLDNIRTFVVNILGGCFYHCSLLVWMDHVVMMMLIWRYKVSVVVDVLTRRGQSEAWQSVGSRFLQNSTDCQGRLRRDLQS